MKHSSKQTAVRLGAAAMSALLLTSLLPTALAASSVVDESYYGTLDYYGGLTEGSVVKSYRTNGNSLISDIGAYDSVTNLTDHTEPTISGDKVTFDLGDNAPANFYFEGATSKPYDTMPFTISISYRMNGVETDPEDMAGQTGVAEILLDILPNKAASEYQRNNFCLEAVTVLKDSDILSVEAPGGQIQKVGDLDAILYMVMPGEEQHFTLRIGTESFTFGGVTFLLEPATLSQLDQVAQLRDAKEEVSDAAKDINASLDAILNSLDGMGAPMKQAASGLDQLDAARQTLSAGKQQVYNKADQTLDSMTNLSKSLAPVVEHLKTAKTALQETTGQVQSLSSTVTDLRPDLDSLRTSMSDLRTDLTQVNDTLLAAQENLSQLSPQLDQLQEDLEDLKADLDSLQDKSAALRKALNGVSGIDTLTPITITQNGKTYTTDEIRAAHDQAESIYTLCATLAAMQGTPFDSSSASLSANEAAFVTYVLTNTDTIAAAAVNADKATTDAIAQKAAAAASQVGQPGDAAYEQVYTQYYQGGLAQAKAAYVEQLSDQNTVSMMAYLHYEWKDGAGIDAQLTQADTFNSLISGANGSISQANQDLTSITKATSALLSCVETMLGSATQDSGLISHSQSILDTLTSLVDLAQDYDSSALYQHLDGVLVTSADLLSRTDTILEQTSALSDTLTKYEPEAQQALDDAQNQINASVALLNNLNSFSASFENLLQSSDRNLDQGAKNSLSGLSETLRNSANALNNTGTIRTAKSSITELLEDKWDEYTGEKNNMLNMDSNATMVSLTSSENQTPNSLQILLRSQEITLPNQDSSQSEADQGGKTTLWQRIGRMFHDIGAIFTGD